MRRLSRRIENTLSVLGNVANQIPPAICGQLRFKVTDALVKHLIFSRGDLAVSIAGPTFRGQLSSPFPEDSNRVRQPRAPIRLGFYNDTTQNPRKVPNQKGNAAQIIQLMHVTHLVECMCRCSEGSGEVSRRRRTSTDRFDERKLPLSLSCVIVPSTFYLRATFVT